MGNPRVFISHSHTDVRYATKIQRIIRKQGAETFLDQDEISIGDSLPARIIDGISWCDIVLLIWSWNSVASKYVADEIEQALQFRKRIIVYSLDNTEPPQKLNNPVYISVSDMNHANGLLLSSIFGNSFKPKTAEIFPGTWLLYLSVFGVANATYTLELRPNGQITGQAKLETSGLLGNMLQLEGMGNFLNMNLPVDGSWSYEEGTQILTINTEATGFGQTQYDTVNIRTSGRESGELYGEDFGGRKYVLKRLR